MGVCLLLQVEQVERKEEATMESGSTRGIVLGQRRVPFKELRMGTLLGAGGCGPDAWWHRRYASHVTVDIKRVVVDIKTQPYITHAFLLGACCPGAHCQDAVFHKCWPSIDILLSMLLGWIRWRQGKRSSHQHTGRSCRTM